jgi:hypothetical protein
MVWEMEVSQWSSFESPVDLTDRSSGDLSILSSICVPLGMLVLGTMLYFRHQLEGHVTVQLGHLPEDNVFQRIMTFDLHKPFAA